MPSSTQLTHNLIDVAMGRKPADRVLRKVTWVCVQSWELVPESDISIINMAIVANKLSEIGGGQVVVNKRKVIGLIELSTSGLMSVEKAGKVAKIASTILEVFRACGSTLTKPNMTMSLLAWVVSPPKCASLTTAWQMWATSLLDRSVKVPLNRSKL